MFPIIKIVLCYIQAKMMVWQYGETLENFPQITYRTWMTGQIKKRQEGVKYFIIKILHKDKHAVNYQVCFLSTHGYLLGKKTWAWFVYFWRNFPVFCQLPTGCCAWRSLGGSPEGFEEASRNDGPDMKENNRARQGAQSWAALPQTFPPQRHHCQQPHVWREKIMEIMDLPAYCPGYFKSCS